ncbi:TRAFAC clade GTPase domain-containing protein [Desulfotignum phosphitoxidans]|jgi:hypothetical protein|uniref:Double-GTPase 2 domain-containing protein n=1 Tax=Desulfotignum phosphitoxidans DSM 13687 TaxID=1286635 RepID=S0G481_9BACT|nr:hypothetical protein Dpo_1c08820 [Desulfotignum phosphitoxidans DSM 13687]
MNSKCSNPNCFVHEGESCVDGHLNLTDCKHFRSGGTESKTKAGPTTIIESAARVPWSGATLGLADLITLLPRSRSILVGVLGAHDAGKTTLLLGNYLNCLRGSSIAQGEFCGSWTLGAWEALAAWSRFDDAARTPHFPPHTPRGTIRAPGLLHLALRRADQSLRDVLLGDAPGEWFTRWAVHDNAPDAEGARWTVEHADTFLVMADCDRLSGPDRGSARADLRQLLERLGGHVGKRPVVLVWTKTDKKALSELTPGIRDSIQRALKESIPHATESETTVCRPESLTEALSSVLDCAWTPARCSPLSEPVLHHQPFSAFRGRKC